METDASRTRAASNPHTDTDIGKSLSNKQWLHVKYPFVSHDVAMVDWQRLVFCLGANAEAGG